MNKETTAEVMRIVQACARDLPSVLAVEKRDDGHSQCTIPGERVKCGRGKLATEDVLPDNVLEWSGEWARIVVSEKNEKEVVRPLINPSMLPVVSSIAGILMSAVTATNKHYRLGVKAAQRRAIAKMRADERKKLGAPTMEKRVVEMSSAADVDDLKASMKALSLMIESREMQERLQ